jgi:DNA-binding FrmR family transcriptional regulator
MMGRFLPTGLVLLGAAMLQVSPEVGLVGTLIDAGGWATVVVAMVFGWIVPGPVYRKEVERGDKRDAQLDDLIGLLKAVNDAVQRDESGARVERDLAAMRQALDVVVQKLGDAEVREQVRDQLQRQARAEPGTGDAR